MKRFFTLLLLLALGAGFAAQAQVGVGTTTPDANSALDIRATDKGLLIPRLTAAQRTAITSPPQGLMVYQTDGTAAGGPQTGFWYYAGAPAQWVYLSPGGDNLGTGVATTNVNLQANKLVGGTAAAPSPDGVQVSAGGQVGVGLGAQAPTEQLQVDGGNLKIGRAQWTGAANDRLLKFGDAGFVTLGEAGGDDVLQFQAKDFRLNPSGRYSGNVGIGLGAAVAASEQLEVGGNVKITGAAGTDGLIFPDGTKQTTAANGGGLTLPYSGTYSSGGPVFQITNTSSGIGLRGASASGQGVVGRVNGTGPGQGVVGVKGTTIPNVEDAGVVGLSEADYGVYARSSQQTGVVGISDGTAAGVAGVAGTATAPSGTGVLGTASSGSGVRGVISSASADAGSAGVRGINQSTTVNGTGVRGSHAGTGQGVYGSSAFGVGVYGTSNGIGDNAAVRGFHESSGTGVLGTTTEGDGVRGVATGGNGVQGKATGNLGVGVLGTASGTTGRAGYFTQTNAANTVPAVEIVQSGTGPALKLTGKANTSNTGTANILPVAYGRIGRDTNLQYFKVAGTSNWTVSFDGTSGNFIITLTSPDLASVDPKQLVVQLTPSDAYSSGTTYVLDDTNATPGTIRVLPSIFFGSIGFCFTVYRP